MSAGVRAKLLAGLPYLAVAPDGRRRRAATSTSPSTDTLPASARRDGEADAAALAEQWALGTAMTRIIDALDAVGAR